MRAKLSSGISMRVTLGSVRALKKVLLLVAVAEAWHMTGVTISASNTRHSRLAQKNTHPPSGRLHEEPGGETDSNVLGGDYRLCCL